MLHGLVRDLFVWLIFVDGQYEECCMVRWNDFTIAVTIDIVVFIRDFSFFPVFLLIVVSILNLKIYSGCLDKS